MINMERNFPDCFGKIEIPDLGHREIKEDGLLILNALFYPSSVSSFGICE